MVAIDAHLRSPPIEDAAEFAQSAERMGFEGAWTTEVTHSPFTLSMRMAETTDDIDIGTAIAVAFPRSPMVTAYTAWDLQSFTGGRFILGLGTQVKGHIERRFSETWDAPGPRLRDYVRALRAIWESWQNEIEVDYHGEFYDIDLCPPDWRPEPIANPDVPIYVAGVNPFNIKLAGHLCNGLHIHPVHSPKYIEQAVVPNIERGARRGERDPDDVTLAASTFAIVGDDDAERERVRRSVKQQIGFYGSTRTYRRIFDVHGWGDVCDELHELSVTDRWDEMADVITGEMLEAFAIEGTWDDLLDQIEDRYSHVDRVSIYNPFRGEAAWSKLTG